MARYVCSRIMVSGVSLPSKHAVNWILQKVNLDIDIYFVYKISIYHMQSIAYFYENDNKF